MQTTATWFRVTYHIAATVKMEIDRFFCFTRIFGIAFAATPIEISVDSVWPLYGPVAGGSRVTITGQNLFTVTAVYFGQHRGSIETHRSAFRLFIFVVLSKFGEKIAVLFPSGQTMYSI